jgi:hypothetical protein
MDHKAARLEMQRHLIAQERVILDQRDRQGTGRGRGRN